VEESVELATILLTDLVGSTRLANSVGPVRADELREAGQGQIALLSGEGVQEHGYGTFEPRAGALAAQLAAEA
jgi:hypothetical protein